MKKIIIVFLFFLLANLSGELFTDKATAESYTSPPTILYFTASKTEVATGQEVILKWSTKNAMFVFLNDDGEKILHDYLDATGSMKVYPKKTTIYVLALSNPKGTSSRVIVVKVPANKPKIKMFEAHPPQITKGRATTLIWQTEKATTLTIWDNKNNTWPIKEPSGRLTVEPRESTTYHIRATNINGSTSAQANVIVSRPRITQISIRFYTMDNDKDWDTKVVVRVYKDNKNNPLASWSLICGQGNTKWEDWKHAPNELKKKHYYLALHKPIYLDELSSYRLNIESTAQGNDKWQFGYTIAYRTNTGVGREIKKERYPQDRIILDSRDGRPVSHDIPFPVN